ncbi:MAG: YkgJ family cysteine cluster protein [Solirubrobacterales bacterium]
MADALFDPDQRFTCSQCGNCCRRGWEIAVSAGEAELYHRSEAGRWFREATDGAEGATRDPFEPISSGLHRIRKRADGACGFLSLENRCRIHEELGGDRKPLTCRLYPFQFHETVAGPVMTASFACPTIVANEGAPVRAGLQALLSLRGKPPGPPVALRFSDGRPIAPRTLATLRAVFRKMLDGSADLGEASLRIAATLDDLTRHRVVRLKDEAFAEYVELTARHAAEHGQRPAPRTPSALGRWFFRGLVFMALAARLQRTERRSLGLRLRLFGLLLHTHGLGPPACGIDLARVQGARLPLHDPAVMALARRYLTAAVETLGTGRLPVADELCLAAAIVDVAVVLGALRAVDAGRPGVDAASFTQGLMDATDLSHIEGGGWLGSFLRTFIAGTESFAILAGGA